MQGSQGLIPMTTGSGQVQFTQNLSNTSFSTNQNTMDLVFNRKVMKPIRGGGAGLAMGQSKNQKSQGFGAQLTFDQFMSNQKKTMQNERRSIGAKAMDYNTPHKTARAGAPLIKPEFQKEYKTQMGQLQSQKDVARKVKGYHANMNKSKQMVAAMKMREAQALAELPIDDTIPDSDDDEDDNDEEEGSEEEQQDQKMRRYASQGPPQK